MMGYYGAYFEEAGPQREAEIIRELGTPEELVRRITEGRIEKALECRMLVLGDGKAVPERSGA